MGLAFGALGAWWGRRRRLSASVVAGTLLMAEPLVLHTLGVLGPDQVAGEGVPTVLRLVPRWRLTLDRGAIPLAVYAMEFLVGLGLVILAAWGVRTAARARRHRSPIEKGGVRLAAARSGSRAPG